MITQGSHAQYQERERRGFVWLLAGIATAAIIVPTVQTPLITVREQPRDADVVLGMGSVGPNVRPPITDTILTVREQPREGRALWDFSASFSQAVVTSVAQPVLIAREQPREGLGTLASGVQGPNVRPPVSDLVLTVRAQPREGYAVWHFPTSFQAATFKPPGTDLALTTREQPREGVGTLSAGVQGPNVRPPSSDSIITTREQPREGYAVYHAPRSFQVPGARPPVTDYVLTAREQSREGYSSSQPGIQGPNVRPPVADGIITRREQPREGVGWTWSLDLPAHPIIAYLSGIIVVRQEMPDKPSPSFARGPFQLSIIEPVEGWSVGVVRSYITGWKG